LKNSTTATSTETLLQHPKKTIATQQDPNPNSSPKPQPHPSDLEGRGGGGRVREGEGPDLEENEGGELRSRFGGGRGGLRSRSIHNLPRWSRCRHPHLRWCA